MRLSQIAKKVTAGVLACLLAVTMTGLLSACGSGDPLATTQEAQQDTQQQEAQQPETADEGQADSKKDTASEKKEDKEQKAQESSKAEKSGSSSKSSSNSKKSSSTSKPKNDTITVKVTIDSSRAHSHNSKWPSSMGSKTVTLKKGATVRDALGKMGVSVRGTSYVTSINGLAEFSCGSTSGWKYSVDGTLPGKACNTYKLNGGEVVRWVYVLDVSDYE